ncbi:MAG: RNA methyltransferase [Pseudomonadaceae bacterium]|nr:RNA methyltransferase [Pseudomonadaceae bacterium]
MTDITSPTNPRVKSLAKLAEKKHRAESGLFLLEGEEYVRTALQTGWQVEEVWHTGEEPPSNIRTSTIRTSTSVLSKITGKPNPQAVLGVLKQRWNPLPTTPQGLWLALDRPRDPGNLGTIIRTADAVGAAGVILIGEATDPYAPECVRATVGSLLHVPLAACSEADFIGWAKGKRVIGTHLNATKDFRTFRAEDATILLMGNESEGLTDALTNICTCLAKIPMRGHTESLNLATATALMLYQLQADNLTSA